MHSRGEILMQDLTQAESKQSPTQTVKRLLAVAGGLRAWLVLALIVDLFLAVFIILQNHFIRLFFEAVEVGDMELFWRFVGLAVVIAFITVPLSYAKKLGTGQFSERTLTKLRSTIAGSSTRLPIHYLEERHSGDLLSVLNADLAKLKNLLANNLLDLVGQSVRGITAFIYIISINWFLALAATILTPLIFLVISALTQPISKRSEEMQEEIGKVNSVARDVLSGAMVVKAFNLVSVLDGRFRQANQHALKKGLGIARLNSIVDGVTLPMAITPFILAIGLGGYLVIQGQITFGSLFAFINLLNYVVNPLAFLPSVFASISEASGAAGRIFHLVDQPAERTDGIVTQAPADPALAVAFHGLSFSYGENAILKDINLEVSPGETVAIVGPSGGGKSTMVKLILGYYPLPQGSLQVMGSDVNEWQLPALRQQMAIVAQDTYLFPTSIAENIRLGKPDASQEAVEQAAKQANIHDFICSLHEGYNTSAGEWGGRLSGGQRQRISLARAILKDAPILLLDEPTSALDTESEALVQQALQRFTAGRTTLVIAHRLSTIKNADRVLVLQEGKIIEQGTHEQLIAMGGAYLDLYQRQFRLDQAAGNGAGSN
jgi:ABC-type multidrug transport system fused ATPase/permease subunit